MNCREFQKRMPELFDRDPDPEVTADLMEHAHVCAKCAGELDAAMSALSAVSPSLKLEASPGLKERTMKQIHRLDSQSDSYNAVPARRGLIARSWRYALAAAVMLAVLGVFTFRGGSSNAFAQVMEQLSKVRAWTYTQSANMDGIPSMSSKVSFKEPGRIRMEMGAPVTGSVAVSIMDMNKKKLVTLMEVPTKQCITFDVSGDTSTPQQGAQMNFLDELRRMPASGAESVGTREINGCKAVGHRLSKPGMSFVVWTDANKQRLVLVEYEMTNIKGMKGEMSSFNFDAQLDDSLFSVDPPAGYKVIDGKTLKLEAPSEEKFIKVLKKYAEETEGDEFLESLSPGDLMKMAMKRKKTAPQVSMDDMSEFMKQNQENTMGLMFAMQMSTANDFHYAGKGVKLGDALKPICWYKPTGKENYRVIYGDLSVREVAPGEPPTAAPK